MSENTRPTGLKFANLGGLGWKYYNQVRKKAMEQEFSWSGLFLSMSIAFFVVIAAAQGLSLAYESVSIKNEVRAAEKVYYLKAAPVDDPIKLDWLDSPSDRIKIA